MKISILIPAHNEEKSIRKCIESCLKQTRKADEIIVVNDGSTDKTGNILADFKKNQIKVVDISVATGNKSFAQEMGLPYVTGEVFICTDADTILDKHFVELIEKEFSDPEIMAVAGYVKSLKYNWLTICRGLEYAISQNVHKLAQSYINFMFVVPGSAGAFRTEIFRKDITIEHDTVTEDLDFTYKLHQKGYKIKYSRAAIVYTQDPVNFRSYIGQVRRWYGGGWQNFVKHFRPLGDASKALELSLIYIEGVIFSFLFFLIPIINIRVAAYFMIFYLLIVAASAVYAAIIEKRADLLFAPLFYIVLVYINSWIFLEQFLKIFIFRRKKLGWIQPDRIKI
jgi:cellulose synthase/poly-beta-1,6-N-acetylglucosamine synthase-like glycosyltransferase